MKKSRISTRFLLRKFPLLFFILICSGCAAFSVKYRPLPSLADPAAYFQSINVQTPAFFSATARIKCQSSQGTLSAPAAVFAHLSSSLSLRIELYGFLNQLVFLLTTDGTAMQIFYPYSNSFYAGTISYDPFAPRLGGRIFSLVATDLLYGLPPRAVCSDTHVVSTQDGPWYRFEIISDICGPQHIWIDPANKKIVKCSTYTKSGVPIYESSYSDFTVIGDFILPKKIDLIFHDTGTRLSIKYQEINVLQRIDEQMFFMRHPTGARVFSLKDLPQNPLIQPQ